ncbi:FAD-dependent oxidoreductase, partial [Vibrio alginolyticus]|nr:FAD-dependent oxidoreductase [Vibrio alginolyticus]
AQQRKAEISGVNHTWFCGAYWHNGFHEDGVKSALDVVTQLQSKAARVDKGVA